MKKTLILIAISIAACATPTSTSNQPIDEPDGMVVPADDPDVALASSVLDDWLGGKTSGDRVCIVWNYQACCSMDGSYCCCTFAPRCNCQTP